PRTGVWRSRADMPRCMMAGTAMSFGQSHIFVLGGADGSLFDKADELKEDHPGFPRMTYAYHTITDTWCESGESPKNHVTTVPVMWNDRMIVASGEVRPRVRSPGIWSVTPIGKTRSFGAVNYAVLGGYLAAIVIMGVYFARRNRDTEGYFRGSKNIPWWAAGCSIFATMLSSLTYTGLPSKAFAQDWVYLVGSLMIPVVAVFAVLVAMPFYRRIDATSAYEYFELRFNRGVRLFASGSFTLFHVFRMAVVMSLTGLALAVATPLTAAQAVLLMGVLSIAYCTFGGIEAVIWTDTLQTIVLLGGAVFALVSLLSQNESGWSGAIEIASNADKMRYANWTWDPTTAQLAFWVLIVGGLGQNLSSYTADQAVVQRYMTTKDERLATKSIWTNALLAIPATLLFLSIGTALFVFYRNHPDKLDATTTTDQIFPLFIANELPIGIAGLIVAGIFSAAQSTVSTSMNSTATTVVTDFLRPAGIFSTEKAYLNAARIVTVLMGVLGTLLGLIFIDPEIRSLFDAFLKVIGLFMGVLGGLFILGVLTRRANSIGAMLGALIGAGMMIWLWQFTSIQGYLYATCGVASCFAVGYVASLLTGSNRKDLTGLTVHTVKRE
ncbi:MAG: sodium:solute symporter, partial [Planctomycetota bacterium]